MQHVKAQIKIWNVQVFKNIFVQKEEVARELTDIIQHDLDTNTYKKQKQLQATWKELRKKEETYWRQKSR